MRRTIRHIIRAPFGGSNRKHHLRMSASCAGGLAYLSIINPTATVLGYSLQMPHPGLWLVAAVACYGHEMWATADRDEQHKRLPKTKAGWANRTIADRFENWYWWKFGDIPHRHALSHGPLTGTAVRVAYGWWPVLVSLWLLWGVSPFWALWLGVAMGIGALVNDLGHLLLDM